MNLNVKKRSKDRALEDTAISGLFEKARLNWDAWRCVFEHAGSVSTNPVLADKRKFARFCAEYYVNRTIGKGKHDEFRRNLRDSRQFRKAIRDDSGKTLDKLERHLRPRFGSKKGKNRLVSALSKVAAFVRPERFVAWDRFAKKGLNIDRNRSASSPFETYSDYLAEFDRSYEGESGRRIAEYAKKRNRSSGLEGEPRFLRRVLDMYLMKCGGRWSPKRRRSRRSR